MCGHGSREELFPCTRSPMPPYMPHPCCPCSSAGGCAAPGIPQLAAPAASSAVETDVGCAGYFCAKDSVLPIADCFRFALALLSPTAMSLFNTGFTPRDAEARANAPLLLFWSRALLRAAGCFVPARMQVPAGGSGCHPRGQRCSLLTYDGLFPFLLQLAPAPTATLTLFTILTPVEHERRGQPQKGNLQGTLQPAKGR